MEFSRLVHYFHRIEETTKRLSMFDLLAELFREADVAETDKIIYLVQGELLPPFHGINIGMSEKYLLRAIAKASGITLDEASDQYRRMGDMGALAEKYTSGEGRGLSVCEIYLAIDRIAAMAGKGSVDRKIDAVCELLASVSAMESRYLIRFLSGRLRLGAGDATILEALALAKGDRAYRPLLDRAYNLTSDLGYVAKTFFQSGEAGIGNISVQLGYPIRPALCERAQSPEEMIERMQRCVIEVKYDGFRCQVHKDRNGVAIFSRNQERTTPMFPEIVEEITRRLPNEEIILEGEALAYNEQTGDLLPFQTSIQRKRKHGVEAMARQYPLKFYLFDLLYFNGSDYTKYRYTDRREKLAEILQRHPVQNPVMMLSEAIETDDPKVIRNFFDAAVERGLEGIIAKRPDSPYTAGSRNFNWIKLKRSYKGELADSVDLCIIGYYAGKGHRAQFGIGTILCAAYDPVSDSFKSLTKIGTGFSEEELGQMKGLLDETASSTCPLNVDSAVLPDVWIYPKHVVTVMADEITRSPNHTAGKDAEGIGYALRFPRVIGFIRADKRAEDATTVPEIIRMFERQKHVKTAS